MLLSCQKIFSLRSRGVWSFPIVYFEKKYIEKSYATILLISI
jgi:hypothetical protein